MRAGAALLVALAAAAPGPAAADPLFGTPVVSAKGRLAGAAEEDPVELYLTLEARALGVAGAHRLTAWPDRARGIEGGRPELVAGRAGLVAQLRSAPLTFVVRLDVAEATAPNFGKEGFGVDETGALAGAIVDDLHAVFRPYRPLVLVGGRARVPFTKQRQFDETELPLAAPPFVIDRIAPDRRHGLLLVGDLGAGSYAAGVYEDLDALEPRAVEGDPSAGGALAAVAHLEWTPAAPMMGSNPPGRVPGARGPLPTPRADPWFDTVRVSLGLGTLFRLRDDGSRRFDTSFSVQLKWRRVGGIAEVLLAVDGAARELGGWGELYVTPIDRLALVGRAEWDGGAGADGAWSAGGGVTFAATRDRRSRLGFLAWARGDVETGRRDDGAVVLVQTAL